MNPKFNKITIAMLTISILLFSSSLYAQPKKDKKNGPPEKPQGPPPKKVRVALVKSQIVQQKRLVVGRIEARWRSTLSVQQAGLVTEAPPESGTTIKKGDVILKVDDKLIRHDIEAAQATIKQSESKVQEAKQELERITRERERIATLVANKTAQPKELADQRNREAAAIARVKSVEAENELNIAKLKRHEEELSKTVTYVPFDAITVNKLTELGQWIAPGDPIAEIVHIDLVKALINIPEYMIHLVNLNDEVDVHIDAINETRTGRVFRMVPNADHQSRTFPISVRLKNDDASKILLRPGMTVSVELPTTTKVETLIVPRNAVHTTPNGTRVFVSRNESAVAVPVTVLFGVGPDFAISADLKPGEMVVTEGNESLQPGTKLIPTNAAELTLSKPSPTK